MDIWVCMTMAWTFVAHQILSSDQVKKKDATLETTVENIQPEVQVKDDVCEEKQEDTLKEEEGASMEAEAEAGDAAMNKKEQHLAESKATEVGVEPVAGVEPVTTWEESMEEDLENRFLIDFSDCFVWPFSLELIAKNKTWKWLMNWFFPYHYR